jgi:hypothetical protein
MNPEKIVKIDVAEIPNDENIIEDLLQEIQMELDSINNFDSSTYDLEKKILKIKFHLIYKLRVIRGDYEIENIDKDTINTFSVEDIKSKLFELNEVILFLKKTKHGVPGVSSTIKSIKKTKKFLQKLIKAKTGKSSFSLFIDDILHPSI